MRREPWTLSRRVAQEIDAWAARLGGGDSPAARARGFGEIWILCFNRRRKPTTIPRGSPASVRLLLKWIRREDRRRARMLPSTFFASRPRRKGE